MKALVYHGPGKKAWEEVPDPEILAPTDAPARSAPVTSSPSSAPAPSASRPS